jgi:hypothetical protein
MGDQRYRSGNLVGIYKLLEGLPYRRQFDSPRLQMAG